MASERFDELTRRLSGTQSRATMLKTLLAVAVGGALLPQPTLAAHEGARSEKACLKKGQFCTHGRKCCKGLACKMKSGHNRCT